MKSDGPGARIPSSPGGGQREQGDTRRYGGRHWRLVIKVVGVVRAVSHRELLYPCSIAKPKKDWLQFIADSSQHVLMAAETLGTDPKGGAVEGSDAPPLSVGERPS
jgi:hypothetical protein